MLAGSTEPLFSLMRLKKNTFFFNATSLTHNASVAESPRCSVAEIKSGTHAARAALPLVMLCNHL